MKASGWVEAMIYVWVIAALNLTYAAAIALGVHPVAFLLEAFLAAAVCLLAVAGPGQNAHRILFTPQTWAYGVCTILCEIFYYFMMAYVQPADASIFVRLNVPVAIALGWLFLGRRVGGLRIVGALFIVLAIAVTGWWFPATHVAGFIGAALATAVTMAGRNFFAEFHPWNRAAKTVIEKMRVTGLVVMATSLAGLAAVAGLSLLADQGVLPAVSAIPTLAQMTHAPTVLLALLLGCAIITAMQYLMFSAVVKITSENFFAMMVFTPFATLALQELMGGLGLPGLQPGGWYILPFLFLLLIGNILIVWPARARPPSPTGDAIQAVAPPGSLVRAPVKQTP
jgi:drug/metabolite transporter (DMT)-like permease